MTQIFIKKLSTLLLILSCQSMFCYSQITKTDLQKMNLQGKVKSIEYESYTVNMKKKKKQKEWSQTFFNEAGNKILEFTRDAENPEMAARHVYSYDDKGNLLAIAHFDMDSNLQTLHKFSFDSVTKKETENIFDKDSVTLKLQYVYQYNDKGLKVTIDGYDMKLKTNNRISNYSFQYDSWGNKTEEVTTLSSLVTTYTYRYDYNDSSQINIKHITLIQSDMESSRSIQYVYDKRGNLIEEQWAYGDEPFKDKSVYTLDKGFNWTKRIDTVNGKESYFAERKIIYY